VVIEVEDNGPGMPDSVKSHIFEPFYTPPKKWAKGRAWGCRLSYFIITEHHKGKIEVDSTPGKGTRFTVRLPLPDKKM
jgi:signal transduction histidine kinase